MMALKGLARYMRFIAKRERIISPIWIVAMVGLTAGLVAMYPGIFPTEEAMLSMAQALNTPSMVALMGPVYGMDELSMAIVMAHECLLWSMIPTNTTKVIISRKIFSLLTAIPGTMKSWDALRCFVHYLSGG